MRTPEGNVKQRVKEILHSVDILPFQKSLAKIRAGETIHGSYSMPSSSGYGEAGIGDFLLCVGGHYMEIETKTPNGKHRAIQKARGEVVSASYGTYFVIRFEEHIDELKSILSNSFTLYQQNLKRAKEVQRSMH